MKFMPSGNTECLKIARVLLGQHAVFIRLADNVFHTGRVHSEVFILVVAEAAHVRVETFKVNTRHVKAQGDRLIHAVVVAGLIRRTDELDEVSVTGAVNEALRFVCRKTVLIVDNHVCYCAIFEHGIYNPEGTGTSHYYFKEGTYYTIPYRSLMPKNIKNLLAAGRCISGSHEAQASFRIMPTCCSTGEAAGVAAAVAAQEHTDFPETDVKKIQALLRKHNAFIGE